METIETKNCKKTHLKTQQKKPPLVCHYVQETSYSTFKNVIQFYSFELSLGSALKISAIILVIIFNSSDPCHFRERTL